MLTVKVYAQAVYFCVPNSLILESTKVMPVLTSSVFQNELRDYAPLKLDFFLVKYRSEMHPIAIRGGS